MRLPIVLRMPNLPFRSATMMILLGSVACSGADGSADVADAAATIDAPSADAASSADATADAAAPPADAVPPADAEPPADAAPPDATPATIAVDLSAATTTSAIGGHTTYTGSVVVTDLCPAGHVLAGLAGHTRGGGGSYHGPIQAICRPIAAFALTPVEVTVGEPAVTLPLRGEPQATDVEWTRACAADQIVVGVQGRNGAIIDQIVTRCAALTPAAADAHALVVGAPANLPAVGGVGGAAFGPFDCASGQIAVGVVIYHSGDPGFGLGMQYLDGLGLVCATPSLP